MTTPRVVFDTNVVLSALVFRSPGAHELRASWRDGRCVPLVSTATAQELLRVLTYPKFRLSPEDREELLADYLPWVTAVDIPVPSPRVPECRDPGDRPFLELAVACRYCYRVSDDADLHAVKRTDSFEVMTPADWLRRVR